MPIISLIFQRYKKIASGSKYPRLIWNPKTMKAEWTETFATCPEAAFARFKVTANKLKSYILFDDGIEKDINEFVKYIKNMISEEFRWSNYTRYLLHSHRLSKPAATNFNHATNRVRHSTIFDKEQPCTTGVRSLSLKHLVTNKLHQMTKLVELNENGEFQLDYRNSSTAFFNMPISKAYADMEEANRRRIAACETLATLACPLHSFHGTAMPPQHGGLTTRCHHATWHTKTYFVIRTAWRDFLGLPIIFYCTHDDAKSSVKYALQAKSPFNYSLSTYQIQGQKASSRKRSANSYPPPFDAYGRPQLGQRPRDLCQFKKHLKFITEKIEQSFVSLKRTDEGLLKYQLETFDEVIGEACLPIF